MSPPENLDGRPPDAFGERPPGLAPRFELMLSERQELILRLVVDAYLGVGASRWRSKAIAEKAEVEWGPSTVRAELAAWRRPGT